jgi:hypothetical protein
MLKLYAMIPLFVIFYTLFGFNGLLALFAFMAFKEYVNRNKPHKVINKHYH